MGTGIQEITEVDFFSLLDEKRWVFYRNSRNWEDGFSLEMKRLSLYRNSRNWGDGFSLGNEKARVFASFFTGIQGLRKMGFLLR